jgi:hypothetical protein
MGIVDRVRNMLFSPKEEWPHIAAEPASIASIYTGYVLLLAAVPAIGILVGFRSITFAVANYLIALVMTYVIALVVDALAPKFGGQSDFVAALKLSAYSYTAAFVGGIAHILGSIGGPLAIAATIYAYYTFYLGAPVLRKCTPDKAVVFTIVVVIIGMAIGITVGLALGRVGLAPAIG